MAKQLKRKRRIKRRREQKQEQSQEEPQEEQQEEGDIKNINCLFKLFFFMYYKKFLFL